MIVQQLPQMIAEAMKSQNFLRTEVLRMLSSSFNYERIALQHDLNTEEELAVVKKQAKQRRDSIEAYTKANSPERAQKEAEELKILQEFLPPEISDEELQKLVEEALSVVNPTGMADIGKVIGFVRGKAPDADSGKIAGIVKSKLTQ